MLQAAKLIVLLFCVSLAFGISDEYYLAESEIDSNGNYKVIYKLPDDLKPVPSSSASGAGVIEPKKLPVTQQD